MLKRNSRCNWPIPTGQPLKNCDAQRIGRVIIQAAEGTRYFTILKNMVCQMNKTETGYMQYITYFVNTLYFCHYTLINLFGRYCSFAFAYVTCNCQEFLLYRPVHFDEHRTCARCRLLFHRKLSIYWKLLDKLYFVVHIIKKNSDSQFLQISKFSQKFLKIYWKLC